MHFINYFDDIKFEIDIAGQELLASIDRGLPSKNEWKRDALFEMYSAMIDLVQNTFNVCCIQIDAYFNRSDLVGIDEITHVEGIKDQALQSYCAYIRGQDLDPTYLSQYPIGVLLSTDWYLNENCLNYLNYYHLNN
jgi:hypothetical protein